jgi:hypothetical protein
MPLQGGARIDLDGGHIATPFGHFRVTKVEETLIHFGDSGLQQFKAFGSLDRMTGKTQIFWLRAEEHAKMQAGQSSQLSRSVELNCSVAKRLF